MPPPSGSGSQSPTSTDCGLFSMQLFSDVFSFFLLGGVVVRMDLGCGSDLGDQVVGKGNRSGYGLGRRLDVVVASVTLFVCSFTVTW